jgi:hypothetical protein
MLDELKNTIKENILKTKLKNPLHTSDFIKKNIQERDNDLFPQEIIDYIERTPAEKLTFKGETPIHYETIFYCYGETIPLEDLQRQMKCVIWWLSTIRKYAERKCDTLLLEVFLTPFEKTLPESGPLSSINCNTGFSARCDYGKTITIYREEEWFKVFIHETIHYFGLDFAYSQTPSVRASLKSMFCISPEIQLYETYTEFWAEIIVILIYSNLHSTNLSTIIRKQKKYSLGQARKVLESQGFTYSQIIVPCTSAKSYTENTNAFAYYVLTSLFMYYHTDFIKWCVDNNVNLLQFNTSEFPSLLNWISERYNKPEFISAVGGASMEDGRGLRMISPTINI